MERNTIRTELTQPFFIADSLANAYKLMHNCNLMHQYNHSNLCILEVIMHTHSQFAYYDALTLIHAIGHIHIPILIYRDALTHS